MFFVSGIRQSDVVENAGLRIQVTEVQFASMHGVSKACHPKTRADFLASGSSLHEAGQDALVIDLASKTFRLASPGDFGANGSRMTDQCNADELLRSVAAGV